MKVTTRTGDAGETGLKDKRVDKTSGLIELMGNLDEVMAHLILSYSLNPKKSQGFKEKVDDLILVSSILAGYKNIDDFPANKIIEIEDEIKLRNDIFDGFVYPFDDPHKAQINVLRTVVRRAERSALRELSHDEFNVILIYLNRLSDYVFTYLKEINE